MLGSHRILKGPDIRQQLSQFTLPNSFYQVPSALCICWKDCSVPSVTFRVSRKCFTHHVPLSPTSLNYKYLHPNNPSGLCGHVCPRRCFPSPQLKVTLSVLSAAFGSKCLTTLTTVELEFQFYTYTCYSQLPTTLQMSLRTEFYWFILDSSHHPPQCSAQRWTFKNNRNLW